MNEDLLALTHVGDEYDKYLGAVVPPVFMNSLHVYKDFETYIGEGPSEDHFIYGRVSNPTVHIAERKIAALEHGAQALIFSSGMAAFTSAVMGTCRTGSHIICLRDVYGPVKNFLNNYCIPKLNMSVTYLTGQDLGELEAAIRPETALIILESPATFVFTVVNLREIAKIARRHGVRTYLDNSCCSPLFQKPLDFGIDISMHTMSKYLGGHSDIIGGVLVSKDEELMSYMASTVRELYGGIMGPMEAWLVIRGMRTLDARLQQHQKTAMAVAEFLDAHPKVKKVYYTGVKSNPQRELIDSQQTGHSGLMSFELNASPDDAVRFIDNLRLFGKGCSWGGFESLALCPLYRSSQEELEFLGRPESRGLIRIHCGLEGAENLIEDLTQALEKL